MLNWIIRKLISPNKEEIYKKFLEKIAAARAAGLSEVELASADSTDPQYKTFSKVAHMLYNKNRIKVKTSVSTGEVLTHKRWIAKII